MTTREALKAHLLSLENVDSLWAHLYGEHGGLEARGGMVELDKLHVEAHKREAAR